MVFCKSSPGDFYRAARVEKHSIANMLVIERFMYNILKKHFPCHFTASTTWQEGYVGFTYKGKLHGLPKMSDLGGAS